MKSKIHLLQGDITTLKVDAVVNAANSSLMGGGGVDGAIHRAGGPEILTACRQIVEQHGPLPPGEAVITPAGNLPARYVIHTVGPIWNGGRHNEHRVLHRCYTRSVQLASQHDCRHIAFPNISTGVYGFPKQEAAQVAVNALLELLGKAQSMPEIFLVCFDEENFRFCQEAIQKLNL